MEIIRWLFDTSVFFPRANCGIGWTKNLILVDQISNLFIGISYLAIPLSLFVLYRKIKGIQWVTQFNPWVLILFMSFITACGLVHFNHVVVFFYAPYRFYVLMDCLTAIVSLLTALLLPKVLMEIIGKLPDEQI